jgi:hypothetical protein
MKIKIPLHLIELEDENYHLVAPSVLPDGETGYWVLDTGASKTVFDKNQKQNYKINAQESEKIHTAGIGDKPLETAIGYLHPFWLGKLKVKNLRVALLDLAHINQFYSKAANLHICGLIGGDFLMKHQAVVDYRNRVLIIKKSNHSYL